MENHTLKGKSDKLNILSLLTFGFCLLAFAFLSSCVPIPPAMMPQAGGGGGVQAGTTGYAELDPGSTSVTTMHFVLKGYTQADLTNIGSLAEDEYNKIGQDTGLYSVLAGGMYNIVVYRDQDEYVQKTKEPRGSRAVANGPTVYTYAGPDLDADLAHALTHVVFNNYMGDKARTLRWLNEGLAMYEEVSKMSDSDRATFQAAQQAELRKETIPFGQMAFFMPSTEEKRRTTAWYQQVESVTRYLLGQSSSLTFAAILNELKTGTEMDKAISDNYPGRFPRGMTDLESMWKTTI